MDHVLELERDTRIIAVCQLPPEDELFAKHFPGRPMMPASLLIEALAQAATILLETSNGLTRKAYVGLVSNAKFRRAVVPGHDMRLELEVLHFSEDAALCRGTVTQLEKRCANAEVGMVTVPLEHFFGAEHLAEYLAVYAAWFADTRFTGFDKDPLESLRHVEP